MSAPTPEEIAHWPAPNYVNPKTRAVPLIAVLIVGTVLMLPFVIGRTFTRKQLKARFGIDDWIIFVAAVISIGYTFLGVYATRFGAGYHLWDIKPEWADQYRKIGLAAVVMFTVCVSLPKISVCFTYLRLFQSNSNRVFCCVLITALTCWLISTTLVTLFQCRPVKAYWDPAVPAQFCVNANIFNLTTAVLNSLTDFLVYLWPVQYVWRVRLPLRERLGIIFVFVIGCWVCIAGFVRMWYIHTLFEGYEYFYDGAAIWMASSVEANVGIIFACMHAIKPILSKLIPGLFATGTSGSTASTWSAYNDDKNTSNHRSGPRSFSFQNLSVPSASTHNDTVYSDRSAVAINHIKQDLGSKNSIASIGFNRLAFKEEENGVTAKVTR